MGSSIRWHIITKQENNTAANWRQQKSVWMSLITNVLPSFQITSVTISSQVTQQSAWLFLMFSWNVMENKLTNSSKFKIVAIVNHNFCQFHSLYSKHHSLVNWGFNLFYIFNRIKHRVQSHGRFFLSFSQRFASSVCWVLCKINPSTFRSEHNEPLLNSVQYAGFPCCRFLCRHHLVPVTPTKNPFQNSKSLCRVITHYDNYRDDSTLAVYLNPDKHSGWIIFMFPLNRAQPFLSIYSV